MKTSIYYFLKLTFILITVYIMIAFAKVYAAKDSMTIKVDQADFNSSTDVFPFTYLNDYGTYIVNNIQSEPVKITDHFGQLSTNKKYIAYTKKDSQNYGSEEQIFIENLSDKTINNIPLIDRTNRQEVLSWSPDDKLILLYSNSQTIGETVLSIYNVESRQLITSFNAYTPFTTIWLDNSNLVYMKVNFDCKQSICIPNNPILVQKNIFSEAEKFIDNIYTKNSMYPINITLNVERDDNDSIKIFYEGISGYQLENGRPEYISILESRSYKKDQHNQYIRYEHKSFFDKKQPFLKSKDANYELKRINLWEDNTQNEIQIINKHDNKIIKTYKGTI